MKKTVLAIPLTEDEKKEIKKVADEYGLTMSGFVRLLLKQYVKEVNR